MTKPHIFKTREEWLGFVANELRPHYKKCGHAIPDKVRFGIGFMATGYRSKHEGECWDLKASADKSVEIFINPAQFKPARVAAILAHELVHAAVGHEAGHKAPFKKACTALGLEGKATSAEPGAEMTRDIIAPILKKAGALPHAQLSAALKRKKQGTRLLKAYCETCNYTVRITAKWLELGAPLCGAAPKAHGRMVCDDLEDDEGEGEE